MWHDVVHSFLWVWVSASQRSPLSVLVRNPHRRFVRKISYETGRRRGKARSQGSQQKRAVSDSRGKVTFRERRLLSEELGPVDPEAESASARGWVSVPGSYVGIFKYTLVTDTEAQNLLRLELTQVCACLFFFSFTPSVAYLLCLVCL